MTRTVMIVGLIATLFVTLIGLGPAVSPAGAAEMMQADKAMMKATGDDLMALKKELAAIQAELQKISKRAGAMTAMIDKTAKNYCASVPESLRAAGWAPGLCK
ncbi:MAG TPA: hypothetical protein VFF86_06475 [Candidatus Methylomirabilis sp.]|nr:hypothetical protein [Candidatus Methylomirabilis sp.]